jgi:hypothetical protein
MACGRMRRDLSQSIKLNLAEFRGQDLIHPPNMSWGQNGSSQLPAFAFDRGGLARGECGGEPIGHSSSLWWSFSTGAGLVLQTIRMGRGSSDRSMT